MDGSLDLPVANYIQLLMLVWYFYSTVLRCLTPTNTGMFVVSSSHADPMEEFSRLTQQQHSQQHQQAHKLPKWFSPNILRYYVLVHDVTEQTEAKYV